MPLRIKIIQFLFRWAEEHIVGKKIISRAFIYDADIDAVAGIGAGLAITYPESGLTFQVAGYFFVDDVKIFLLDRKVEFIPVNGIARDLIFYDEFVFWGATGKFSCFDNKGASIIKYALTQT